MTIGQYKYRKKYEKKKQEYKKPKKWRLFKNIISTWYKLSNKGNINTKNHTEDKKEFLKNATKEEAQKTVSLSILETRNV